jgi:hypothetical protein
MTADFKPYAFSQASIPIFGMVFAHWMLPEEPLRWQR